MVWKSRAVIYIIDRTDEKILELSHLFNALRLNSCHKKRVSVDSEKIISTFHRNNRRFSG